MSLLLLFQPATLKRLIVTKPIFLSQNDSGTIQLENNPSVVTLGQNEETVYLG